MTSCENFNENLPKPQYTHMFWELAPGGCGGSATLKLRPLSEDFREGLERSTPSARRSGSGDRPVGVQRATGGGMSFSRVLSAAIWALLPDVWQGGRILSILYEGASFCQITTNPKTLFAIVLLVYLGVVVHNSESNDDMLNLLLNQFSKKGFQLKFIAILIAIFVIVIIRLLGFLCAGT